VATGIDCRMAEFPALRDRFNARGISVVLRRTGGEAVVLGQGVVITASVHSEPNDAPVNTTNGFRHLHNIILNALAPFGTIEMGPVAGSYCDGRFNLTLNGRKLGGTAQQQKTRNYRAVLTHAAITVECDISAHMNLIEAFYEMSGKTRRYDPAVCINLSEVLASDRTDLTVFIAERIRSAHARRDTVLAA